MAQTNLVKPPKLTLAAVEAAGANKAALPWYFCLLQGFFAGAYIAFGGMLAVVVGGGYTEDSPGFKKFLFGAVFPVGLIAVVMTGAELFTGNTMCLFVPAASKKIKWSDLAKNWVISYIGNFVGSIFIAVILCWLPDIFSNEHVAASIRGIAEAKISLGFGKVLLRAIGCNWLVCLAVWQAIAAGDAAGKILGIWWPIMAFVALGYEHCVANMFFVPVGLLYGANDTFWRFLGLNLIPATIGNIFGGMFMMGFAYWHLFSDKPEAASAQSATAK